MGDHVFLKVMPKRGVVRFGKRGKLSPSFIGPFEILERVGVVSYLLALPSSLLGVHEVFHVSMLRKYTPDLTHVVDWGELVVDDNGTFEEGMMSLKVIYFQSIFLIDFYTKRLIYMQESGINFTKIVCSRKLKRKQKL